MAKIKINDKILNIFWEALLIYFSNFGKFISYMAFPILGQLFGLLWVFALTDVYTKNIPTLIDKYPIFDNFSTIFLGVLLITLPGLVLFMKAFWDFLVAYGALNSMTDAAVNTGKIYDFPAYNAVVTRRTFKFIALWFVFSIFTFFAINPLFWVLGFILFVYFVLIFQVFTFEEETSVTGCFKRSFNLVKGNFARTFVLMAVLFLICYYVLAIILNALLDITMLSGFFAGLLEGWASSLPIEQLNGYLAMLNMPGITPIDIAKSVVQQVAFFVIVGFTLPLRSIVWTLWYKNLINLKEKSFKKSTTKSISKTTKKLDPEILRRAELKDDDK